MIQPAKRFWGEKPGFDTGDILHIIVNAGFALVVYLMVFYWQLTFLAFVLVILSKWRILAVKPRFWMPNIRANLVDLIVGLSIVGLLYHTEAPWLGFVWTVLYCLWLLTLKPRDHEVFVGIQASIAQFLGLIVIFMTQPFINSPILACVFAWLVAWSSARHFFSNYEEPHYRIMTLAWSFIVLQLTWISMHWLQYYQIFDLNISVVALVTSIVAVSFGSMYHALKVEKGLTKAVLIENILFGSTLLAVILITAGWTSQL